MLEAANWAPTHGKTEPWRFVVLSEDALQEMIQITHQVSCPRRPLRCKPIAKGS